MNLYYKQTDSYNNEIYWGRILSTFLVIIISWVLISWFVYPTVRIYKQNLAGEANLRQQEWEKKIIIEQAKAQNESATLNAEARIKQAQAESEAEIIRAKGVAEANKIIADGLKQNEEYLRYLWIDKISTANTFYIPTEAGLPILEAGKR